MIELTLNNLFSLPWLAWLAWHRGNLPSPLFLGLQGTSGNKIAKTTNFAPVHWALAEFTLFGSTLPNPLRAALSHKKHTLVSF
jgi:hypothetical protein